MLSILLFHVRLLHIYWFLYITYGKNMHSALFKWTKSRLKVRTCRCHATDTVAVWSTFRCRGEPRGVATNAGRGEGWKLGPLCPTMMWNSPPKTHIDCIIFISFYIIYIEFEGQTLFRLGYNYIIRYHALHTFTILSIVSPEKNILPSRAPGRLPVMAPSPRSPSKMLSPRHQPVALVKTNILDD
jgi:hypothetical protein